MAGVLFFIDRIPSYEDFRIAENLINGNGYSEISSVGPTAIKAPFYPLFLSLFIYLFNSSKIIISIFQLIIFTLTVVPLYHSVKHLFTEKTGLIISLVFFFFPSFFIYPYKIESTSLTIPLMIIQFYFFIQHIKKDKCLCYFYLISGLLFIHQPLSIIPSLFYLLYLNHSKVYFKMIFVLILFALPWGVRNYKQFDKLIFTKSPFWMNIYVGLDERVQENGIKLIDDKTHQELDSLRRSINDIELENKYKEIASPIIKEHPLIYFKIVINNIKQFWLIPNKYLNNMSYEILIIRIIPVLLLNILTAYSLILLFKTNKRIFYLLILFFIIYTLPYAITHATNIRFKLDIEIIQVALLTLILERKQNEI